MQQFFWLHREELEMKRVCIQCGKEFELAKSEMEFYRKKKLAYPKRCRECRALNKQNRAAEAEKKEIRPAEGAAEKPAETKAGSGNKTENNVIRFAEKAEQRKTRGKSVFPGQIWLAGFGGGDRDRCFAADSLPLMGNREIRKAGMAGDEKKIDSGRKR